MRGKKRRIETGGKKGRERETRGRKGKKVERMEMKNMDVGFMQRIHRMDCLMLVFGRRKKKVNEKHRQLHLRD